MFVNIFVNLFTYTCNNKSILGENRDQIQQKSCCSKNSAAPGEVEFYVIVRNRSRKDRSRCPISHGFLPSEFFPTLRSVHSERKHPHVSLDCIHIGISVAQNAKGYTAARSTTRGERGVFFFSTPGEQT